MVWVLHCNVHTTRVPLFNFYSHADWLPTATIAWLYRIICFIKGQLLSNYTGNQSPFNILCCHRNSLYFIATKVLHVVNN